MKPNHDMKLFRVFERLSYTVEPPEHSRNGGAIMDNTKYLQPAQFPRLDEVWMRE